MPASGGARPADRQHRTMAAHHGCDERVRRAIARNTSRATTATAGGNIKHPEKVSHGTPCASCPREVAGRGYRSGSGGRLAICGESNAAACRRCARGGRSPGPLPDAAEASTDRDAAGPGTGCAGTRRSCTVRIAPPEPPTSHGASTSRFAIIGWPVWATRHATSPRRFAPRRSMNPADPTTSNEPRNGKSIATPHPARRAGRRADVSEADGAAPFRWRSRRCRVADALGVVVGTAARDPP
jgi:hypothetical protein